MSGLGIRPGPGDRCRRRGEQARLFRALVHFAAGLLTVSWILWIATITADYLGYQWLGARIGRVGGTVAGFVVTAALAWVLWKDAQTSTARFEAVSASHPSCVRGWTPYSHAAW